MHFEFSDACVMPSIWTDTEVAITISAQTALTTSWVGALVLKAGDSVFPVAQMTMISD